MGRLNNRGYYFTTLAFFIIAFFVISTLYSSYNSNTVVQKRISSMESFLFSLNQDMARQIYISSYRALLSIETRISTDGVYISNSSQAFMELLINGSLNNQSAPLMEGYRIMDWNNRSATLGNGMNIMINYTLHSIIVTQEDPWNILVVTLINLSVSDLDNVASWNRIDRIESRLPIDGFEDPYYLLSTNGLVSNKVIKNPHSILATGSNVSALLDSVNHSYYLASSSAPSFLYRLEGKTTPHAQGIESLVNVAKLSSQGVAPRDKSVVDYIYFSSSNPSVHGISGMPSWFKLDDSHIAAYNLTGLQT